MANARLRELDSLRGGAALAVVFWHYAHHFRAGPLLPLLRSFYFHGIYAVDFFFVLSGFVLARAYDRPERRETWLDNVVRRLARIYPLHFLTLILVTLLLGVPALLGERSPVLGIGIVYNDAYHFILNLSLSHFVGLQDGVSFNTPSWSISTEFYVNLLFFALLAWAGRALVGVSCVLVLLSLGILAGTQNGSLVRAVNLGFFEVTLARTALGFFLGVLLWEWTGEPSTARRRHVLDFVFLLLALAIGTVTWLRIARHFEYPMVAIGFPLLIYSASRSDWVRSLLRLPPLTALGDISYSLYLTHYPVQIVFQSLVLFSGISIDYERPATLAAFLAVCLGIATLSYRYFELPMQAAINRAWRSRRGDR